MIWLRLDPKRPADESGRRHRVRSVFLALFLEAGRMNGPAVAGILAGELEADAVIATCN